MALPSHTTNVRLKGRGHEFETAVKHAERAFREEVEPFLFPHGLLFGIFGMFVWNIVCAIC